MFNIYGLDNNIMQSYHVYKNGLLKLLRKGIFFKYLIHDIYAK